MAYGSMTAVGGPSGRFGYICTMYERCKEVARLDWLDDMNAFDKANGVDTQSANR